MIRSVFETEKSDAGICPAAVDGTRDSHLGAVNSIPAAKVNDDISIKEIATRVESQGWV